MRGIALSLAVSSLGAVLWGGRVLVADRAAEVRHAEAASSAAVSTDRVWYGGTLAAIVVVGSAPDHTVSQVGHTCSTAGS